MRDKNYSESNDWSLRPRMWQHRERVLKFLKSQKGQVLSVGHCYAFKQIYRGLGNCELLAADEFISVELTKSVTNFKDIKFLRENPVNSQDFAYKLRSQESNLRFFTNKQKDWPDFDHYDNEDK